MKRFQEVSGGRGGSSGEFGEALFSLSRLQCLSCLSCLTAFLSSVGRVRLLCLSLRPSLHLSLFSSHQVQTR